MELLSVFFAGLFGAISPFGWIVDQKVEAAFRSRVTAVETIAVRVDNTPSYRLLKGKIQRLRLVSRGVHLTPHLRLKSLAIETDPIAADWAVLRGGEFGSFPQVQSALEKPLNAALQVTLNETDLNRFLASPEVKTGFNAMAQRIFEQLPSSRNQRYEILSATVNFKDNNRLTVDLDLRVSRSQNNQFREFDLRVESGMKVQQGKRLSLVEPKVTVDGKPLPPRLVTIVSERINARFNLGTLNEEKMIGRLLQLKIEEDEVKLAAFVQIANGARGDSPKPSEKPLFLNFSLT